MEQFVKHLCALRRIEEQDRAGRTIVRYTNVGQDHFAHANLYDHIARMGIGETAVVKAIDFMQATETVEREQEQERPPEPTQQERIMRPGFGDYW